MTKPSYRLKIPTAVELGSPAARCAQFGICAVTVLSLQQWSGFNPRHIRQVKAMLSVNYPGCRRIEFSLDAMRSDTLAQFFLPEGFRVDAPTLLPRPVNSRLNLPKGTSTVPGIYNFTKSSGRLVVDLKIDHQ